MALSESIKEAIESGMRNAYYLGYESNPGPLDQQIEVTTAQVISQFRRKLQKFIDEEI